MTASIIFTIVFVGFLIWALHREPETDRDPTDWYDGGDGV